MKFFKPEDFYIVGDGQMKTPQQASDIANEKLEKEGIIVYSNKSAFTWRLSDESKECKALLINIENIEKCTHSSVHVQGGLMVSDTQGNKTTINPIFQCTDCQKQVYPIGFKES